jgi:hypothetical protein
MTLVREPFRNARTTSSASVDVPKQAKQPTERRLDQEALSRMDDEGGSNDPALSPPDAAGKAVPGN